MAIDQPGTESSVTTKQTTEHANVFLHLNLTRVGEWLSRFLTALQHNIGYLVPYS